MKKITIILATVILTVCIASSAWSLTITRTYDPSDIFLRAYSSPSYVDWWFYLTPEFDPSSMYLTDASITLNLRGDGDTNPETATFRVSTSGLQTWTLTNPNIDVTLEITTGLASLQDGTGYFRLTAIEGDFWFESARLTANAVPEPTTLVLLGLGLLGIAGVRRKK